MSKLKIIFFTVAMFIISAVGCFADGKSERIMVEGVDYTYYVYHSRKDYSDIKVYSNSKFYIDNSGNLRCYGEYVGYFDGKFFEGFSSNVIVSSKSQNFVITANNCGISNGGGSVVPPLIAPTVEKALTQIVPQFLEQLKNYLPTCILILSMLLGVSLVPRIIHFLT